MCVIVWVQIPEERPGSIGNADSQQALLWLARRLRMDVSLSVGTALHLHCCPVSPAPVPKSCNTNSLHPNSYTLKV